MVAIKAAGYCAGKAKRANGRPKAARRCAKQQREKNCGLKYGGVPVVAIAEWLACRPRELAVSQTAQGLTGAAAIGDVAAEKNVESSGAESVVCEYVYRGAAKL
jgi:hypothetical protein